MRRSVGEDTVEGRTYTRAGELEGGAFDCIVGFVAVATCVREGDERSAMCGAPWDAESEVGT